MKRYSMQINCSRIKEDLKAMAESCKVTSEAMSTDK